MATELLFATLVYRAPLKARAGRTARAFDARLLQECRQLRADDSAGRRWSARHYRNGYTSYGSAHRMQQLSPTFAALERAIDAHVARFAHTLQLALGNRRLAMTDCWVNIMGRGAGHGLHLHPLATISGVYYVAVPRGAPGLKFEDPRLERFMAAPPRAATARRVNRPWVTLAARVGQLVLFESWLRHEVLPHQEARERVSISFNYAW